MGKSYTAVWPNEIFLVVVVVPPVGNNPATKGDFAIGYQYADLVPEEVLLTLTQEERDEYYNLKRTIEQQSAVESTTFWYFVIGGILGILLLVTLIICLLRLKTKNSQIVGKVEKL